MKSIFRILFITMALLSWLPTAAFAGNESVSGIDAGIVSLNNIPGAIYFDSSKSDHYYYLKLHYGRYYDLQPGNSLLWLVEFEQRRFDDWDWSNTTMPGLFCDGRGRPASGRVRQESRPGCVISICSIRLMAAMAR